MCVNAAPIWPPAVLTPTCKDILFILFLFFFYFWCKVQNIVFLFSMYLKPSPFPPLHSLQLVYHFIETM